MDLVQRLALHLQTSLDTFCWAVEQVPAERFYASSQRKPEAWTVARLVFHLMRYKG